MLIRNYLYRAKGPDSIQRWHLTSIGSPIVEIRRSYGRLIYTMGFPILVRWHLYIESGPSLFTTCHKMTMLNIGIRPGPFFYLLSWSPSHLNFFFQVTWSSSIFNPSDLEAKSLGKIPSDFSFWLGDNLGCSNIVICIVYLFRLIYVTLYGLFDNISTKGIQNSLDW